VTGDPARALRGAGFAPGQAGQPVPIGGGERLSALMTEHPGDV
jgi:hypothetical protein